MSYNGSGTYVPPAGQPVATGTVIQSAAFNTLVTDIGNTFNNVLPRDGQASMAGQLKITDGTSSVPGIAFNSEASSGIFRPVAGTLALVVSGVETLRINNAGHVLIGATADDGTNTLQVNGSAKVAGPVTAPSFSGSLTGNVTGNVSGTASNVTGTVSIANGGTGATTAAAALVNLGAAPTNTPSFTGNVSISSGNLSLTGQCLLGGATGTYSGFASNLTLNYAGGGSMYGMVLKPSTSTAVTNAITFLSSTSTYASGGPAGSIQHLASDAGMNLAGTWQVNGNPIASTNAPTLTNPTIRGYIEQFQALNPGAAVTINPNAGTLIELQVTQNMTITLPAAVAGMSYTIIAYYQGAYSLTFQGGSSLHWAGGTAPVATSASGKFDKYVFTCGSTYTLAQDGGRSF